MKVFLWVLANSSPFRLLAHQYSLIGAKRKKQNHLFISRSVYWSVFTTKITPKFLVAIIRIYQKNIQENERKERRQILRSTVLLLFHLLNMLLWFCALYVGGYEANRIVTTFFWEERNCRSPRNSFLFTNSSPRLTVSWEYWISEYRNTQRKYIIIVSKL